MIEELWICCFLLCFPFFIFVQCCKKKAAQSDIKIPKYKMTSEAKAGGGNDGKAPNGPGEKGGNSRQGFPAFPPGNGQMNPQIVNVVRGDNNNKKPDGDDPGSGPLISNVTDEFPTIVDGEALPKPVGQAVSTPATSPRAAAAAKAKEKPGVGVKASKKESKQPPGAKKDDKAADRTQSTTDPTQKD